MRAAFVLLAALAAAAPAEASPRRVRLFDGKSLAAFYTFLKDKGKDSDPEGVFRVENGLIHVSGKEFGYIATREEFEDFHLVVEYRWGEKTWPPRENNARDSGILFHMQGEDRIWPASIELNIIEGGTGDLILIDGPSIAFEEALWPRLAGGARTLSEDGRRILRGRVDFSGRAPDWKDQLGFRGPRDLERPVGQWNRAEVIAKGDAFQFVVNGKTALRANGASVRRGRIVLQSEGAEILFRRVELTGFGRGSRPSR